MFHKRRHSHGAFMHVFVARDIFLFRWECCFFAPLCIFYFDLFVVEFEEFCLVMFVGIGDVHGVYDESSRL